MGENKCAICGNYFDDSDTYEYRGWKLLISLLGHVMSCAEHFDELCGKRDEQRQLDITANNVKLAPTKGKL